MSREDEVADWPDKFVYVFNASKARLPNMLPVHHAGFSRISRAVIFCGALQNSNKPNDLEHALRPARHLEKWLVSKGVPTRIEYGDSEDADRWSRALAHVCARAEADGLPVIYNAQGGRTATKLGALWFRPENVRVLVVEGAPPEIDIIDTLDGRPSIHRMRKGPPLRLDEWLSHHQVEEVRRTARVETENWFGLYAAPIADLARLLVSRAPQRLAQRLSAAVIGAAYNSGKFKPGDFAWASDLELIHALQAFDEGSGIDVEIDGDRARVNISEPLAGKLLTGGWLEAWIYNRICALKAPGVEISSNIALQNTGELMREARRVWGEADVALLIGDQLHVVEAKAGSFAVKTSDGREVVPTDAPNKALDQIARFRQNLQGGQYGQLWIVNPIVTNADIEPAWAQRARTIGKVLVGPAAVDNLVNQVTALAEEARR